MKRSRGQSTVEFALMMPFMFGITFFILEFQIFAMGMHHTAWASYAAARAHVVSHDMVDLQGDVVDEILTGRIYQAQPPRVSTHRRGFESPGADSDWGGNAPDGVVVSMPGFGSLPYARQLLNIDTEIPTHLGPDEWNKDIEGNDNDNEKRWDVTSSAGRKALTDNNRDDF